VSPEGPCWDGLEGRADPRRAAVLLRCPLVSVDPDVGTVGVASIATERLLDPVSQVPRSLLDDTLRPKVD
jgi:hypothetical protein